MGRRTQIEVVADPNDTDSRIARLHGAGVDAQEIAVRLGESERDVRRRLVALGLDEAGGLD